MSNLNKQLISLTPDALIEMYEVDFSNLQPNFQELESLYGMNIGADSIYRFCPMINGTNPIIWQSKSYQPLPIKAEGFDHTSDGKLPRPKLTIGNPDGLLSKIVHSNEDFANVKITRKRTYARFLDADNFQSQNNPFGESDPRSRLNDDVYFINRKTQEDKNAIQFELVSALELEKTFVPARLVMSDYCSWTYRCDIGCGYKGLPIETNDGQSLTNKIQTYKYPILKSVPEWNKYGHRYQNNSWQQGTSSEQFGYQEGDVVQIIPRNSNNPYKSTPQFFVCIQSHNEASKYNPFFSSDHWLKDQCSKTLSACIKKFGEKNEFNRSKQVGLNFGGFPGTERFNVE